MVRLGDVGEFVAVRVSGVVSINLNLPGDM